MNIEDGLFYLWLTTLGLAAIAVLGVIIYLSVADVGIRCDRINFDKAGGHDDYCYPTFSKP